jgi:magnesium transporter
MVFFADAYLSALLRYGVNDAEGSPIGHLDDILVVPHERFPEVVRLAVREPGKTELGYVPWSAVRTASQEGIRLAPGARPSPTPAPPEEEIHLRRDLLDKQIVDVSGKRVVRVHDLKLGAVGQKVLLTHADVGWRGLLRRMGWEHFTLGICRLFRIHFPERLIAWEHLQTPPPGGEVHADSARDALRRIHPADLADIAEELSAPERAAFLGSMDEEVAADAMQEMETEALVAVVNEFSDEQASDLIEEMDPDAGADLLAELPQERAEALLDLMEPEEAADLRLLLSYPEDSAGGLMTVDQVTVPTGLTAEQALAQVREQAREIDVVYYVYLVAPDGRLAGALSLRELIVADPDQIVDDLPGHEVVSVKPDTKQAEVAHMAARYNLLAIPVVDEEGRMQGIVTADDAIDAVIPTSWKKRIPKAFAA